MHFAALSVGSFNAVICCRPATKEYLIRSYLVESKQVASKFRNMRSFENILELVTVNMAVVPETKIQDIKLPTFYFKI